MLAWINSSFCSKCCIAILLRCDPSGIFSECPKYSILADRNLNVCQPYVMRAYSSLVLNSLPGFMEFHPVFRLYPDKDSRDPSLTYVTLFLQNSLFCSNVPHKFRLTHPPRTPVFVFSTQQDNLIPLVCPPVPWWKNCFQEEKHYDYVFT